MESHKKLLLGNETWVKKKRAENPHFFEESAAVQRPEFMWIGCSDSRVPAELITGMEAGELFVHRNIANLVVHTDFNMLSVLLYAVEVLEVKQVIVCGHYNCGGVGNALTQRDFGLINRWLLHIKDVYRLHSRELEAITDEQARYDRLVELNVVEQVRNLAGISIVQRAWREANRPVIHGWMYDMHTGYLKEIASMQPGSRLEDIYMFDYDPHGHPL